MNTELREEILRTLDEALEARGWDVPPSLLMISFDGDDGIEISELPMPTEDPPGRLLRMAHGIRETGIDRLAGSVDAIAFAYEAWMVVHLDDRDTDEIMEQARQHQLHRREDKVEVRMVSLVGTDVDGISQSMRYRDSGLVEVQHEGGEVDLYAGRIPEALCMLAGHGQRASLN